MNLIGSVEPAIRFCDREHCSPIPTAGPIPKIQSDESEEHPVRLEHLGFGEWAISPNGSDPEPKTGLVELYYDGVRRETYTVKLKWLPFDPCRASNPPGTEPDDPELTVLSGHLGEGLVLHHDVRLTGSRHAITSLGHVRGRPFRCDSERVRS